MVLMFHPSNLPPLLPTQFSAMVHRWCSLSARQKCQLTFLLLGKSRGNQWFLKFSLQDCCGLLILQGQRPLKVAHVKWEDGAWHFKAIRPPTSAAAAAAPRGVAAGTSGMSRSAADGGSPGSEPRQRREE